MHEAWTHSCGTPVTLHLTLRCCHLQFYQMWDKLKSKNLVKISLVQTTDAEHHKAVFNIQAVVIFKTWIRIFRSEYCTFQFKAFELRDENQNYNYTSICKMIMKSCLKVSLYINMYRKTHIENIFKAKYYINQYCISPDQHVS